MKIKHFIFTWKKRHHCLFCLWRVMAHILLDGNRRFSYLINPSHFRRKQPTITGEVHHPACLTPEFKVCITDSLHKKNLLTQIEQSYSHFYSSLLLYIHLLLQYGKVRCNNLSNTQTESSIKSLDRNIKLCKIWETVLK